MQRCHYFPKEILTTAFERIIFFILLEADVEGDIVYCMNSKVFFPEEGFKGQRKDTD